MKNIPVQEQAGERGFVDRLNRYFQGVRSSLFRPVLVVLGRIGVTGTMITNLRLIAAAVFIPWFFVEPWSAAVFMAVVLFLDTFDGALARLQGKASDRGKFLDVAVDQAVYAATIFVFLLMGANAYLVVANMFLICAVYVLATIKKEEFQPSDWIIKVYPRLTTLKLFPVAAFFLAVFLAVDYLNIALLISNALSAVLCLYYFIFIQLRWKKIYG